MAILIYNADGLEVRACCEPLGSSGPLFSGEVIIQRELHRCHPPGYLLGTSTTNAEAYLQLPSQALVE
jgi:hypothetical protein